MPLSTGARLGPYEILASIGAGGMGEVYKAQDKRLDRIVAIKVCNEEFSERFEREARAVAALNHPHICTLHDVGPNYLVMEYIDGRPLQGPLPIDQALKFGAQVCDALSAAHKKGIIHRDLKPGNVMVTKAGVKLLDFGLAKMGPAVSVDDKTLVAGLTGKGQILGTLPYMSPEQLSGADADARSDIFAFGLLLFEMLTGKRAFDGQAAATVIAAILEREAPSAVGMGMSTPAIDRVLRICLAKDPDDRWQSASDLKRELEWIAMRGPESPIAVPVKSRERMWIATAAVAALLTAGLAVAYFARSTPQAQVVRFTITPSRAASFGAPVLSPDGRLIVFTASEFGITRLWLRRLDATEAESVQGTDNAYLPFWSADSRSVGFFTGNTLKKVDIGGGSAPQTITTLSTPPRGGAWNSAGVILFGTGQGIFRIAAEGGPSTPVTKAAKGEIGHIFPTFLPDGQHFIYVVRSSSEALVTVSDLGSGSQQRLFAADSGVVFANGGTANRGFLVYYRGAHLVARPFDAGALKILGDATIVTASSTRFGFPPSTSTTGTLAYTSTRSEQANSRVIWFDRQGKELGRLGDPGRHLSTDLSLSGKSATIVSPDARTGLQHIFIADLTRDVIGRFKQLEGSDFAPALSPDGTRVAFTLARETISGDIYSALTNGAGGENSLVVSDNAKHPNHWSPDGKYLIYDDHHVTQQEDLWVVPLQGDRKPVPFLTTLADETNARFSPDSKWVAYSSDQSGHREVYVQGFLPDRTPTSGSMKWQISRAGGSHPRWRADGKELFYIATDGKVMAVPVRMNPSFEPGSPVALFDSRTRPTPAAPYGVSPDGNRFLINTAIAETDATPIVVVLNWATGLSRK